MDLKDNGRAVFLRRGISLAPGSGPFDELVDLSFRRPEATVDPQTQRVVIHPADAREPVPLALHHLPVAVTLTRTHTVPLRSPRASTTSHHRPGTHPPRAYLPFASLNAFTSIDPRPNSPPSASLATSTISNDSRASNSTSSSSSAHAATRVVVPLRVRSTLSLGPVRAPQISIVAPGFTNAGPRPSITVARARAVDVIMDSNDSMNECAGWNE